MTSPVGLPNGRDLGGLTTPTGTIRKRQLLRSGAPFEPAHADTIAELGIVAVLDLRTASEKHHRPAVMPAATLALHEDVFASEDPETPLSLGNFARDVGANKHRDPDPDELRRTFIEGYRSFVTLPSAVRAVRAAVDTVIKGDSLLVHCSAGKDRTGWVIASVLAAVGVDEDVIVADYLASTEEVAKLYAPIREHLVLTGADPSAFDVALAADPDYLDAAFATVKKDYGSFDRYLRDGLGLGHAEREQLRRRLIDNN